jgi:hypothetical protein
LEDEKARLCNEINIQIEKLQARSGLIKELVDGVEGPNNPK